MSVEIVGQLQDGVTAGHTHGPSQDNIRTTAPKDNGGTGEHFSPTDLMATSLGACMTTIMALWARTRDYNLDGVRYRVEKHMSAELPRRICKLPVQIWVPDDVAEKDRASLEKAAVNCPVSNSISEGIEVNVEFHYVPRGEL